MQKVGEQDAVLNGPQNLDSVGSAEVVLGIPTYNDRGTIARTVEAGLGALNGRLAGQRVVIVNADGGSRDETVEHLRDAVADRLPLLQATYPMYPVDRLQAPIAGVPGRSEAALVIFRMARQLGAQVCVLLDAELESITSDWVDRLAGPVLDGAADLVAPLYQRRKLDGLISSGIVSPFARALFGKRVRQPVGSDLSFSARLMNFFIERTSSPGPAASTLDPWSTIPAITNGFRVGQTFVGPRIVRAHEVPPDLSGTLRQVLGPLFEHTERTAAFWQKVRGSEPVPWFGPQPEIDAEPSEINRKPMIDSFRQGCQNLTELWKLLLPPASLLELRRMERQPDAQLTFTDELWARVLYDFSLGYHLRVLSRDHLLLAITPLYLGWAASFIGEMQNATSKQLEDRLERLSIHFETQKKYLISRWRWPDKFNP